MALAQGAWPAPPTGLPSGGRPLHQALRELQDEGLRLLFSDRVVLSSMRVGTEPEGSAIARLHQLLEPHGLEAREGTGGWLIVMRASSVVEDAARPPPEPIAQSPEVAEVVRVSEAIVVKPQIRLPVRVLDGDRPVRGLGADDFELFVGGKRQPIAHLEELDLEQLAGEASLLDTPAAARRHFLLVFDTGFETLASLSRARTVALRLVSEGLHRTDLVGVATLSEARRPHFALGFSSDRRAALASIEVATGRTPSEVVTDPLGLVLRPAHTVSERRGDGIRRQQALPEQPEPPPKHHYSGASIDAADAQESLDIQAERADLQAALTRLLGLSDSLHELAEALRYLPGRKQVVFFSEGFDDSMLSGLNGSSDSERRRIEQMNRAVEDGEVWQIDTDQRYGNDAAESSFDRMLIAFTESNSVVHVVKTSVKRAAEMQGVQSRDGLVRLASRTGGTYVAATGDVDHVLTALQETTSVTYVLSFARSPDRKARPRKLDVRLRDGVAGRVLHPPSLVEPSRTEPLSLVQRWMAAGSRIASGAAGGEFHSRLSVGRARSDGGDSSVPISVTAPLAMLAARKNDPRPAAEIYVYALKVDGEVEDYFARRVTLPPDLGIGKDDFRIAGSLGLSPGRYTIRSLVLLPSTGATSLASTEIELR